MPRDDETTKKVTHVIERSTSENRELQASHRPKLRAVRRLTSAAPNRDIWKIDEEAPNAPRNDASNEKASATVMPQPVQTGDIPSSSKAVHDSRNTNVQRLHESWSSRQMDTPSWTRRPSSVGTSAFKYRTSKPPSPILSSSDSEPSSEETVITTRAFAPPRQSGLGDASRRNSRLSDVGFGVFDAPDDIDNLSLSPIRFDLSLDDNNEHDNDSDHMELA